jgi:glycosyltransferase involved in cell wall biosynthesis
MRIAYLTEWAPYSETGVLRKLISQIEAWQELGASAQIFSIAPVRDTLPALNFNKFGSVVGRFHQRDLDRYPFARLGYFNKIASVDAMASALKRFAPDVIYYRQNGPWYPGLARLLAIAPTALEINTDESTENRLWGSFFDRFHKVTSGLTHKNVHAFVCVTDEIAKGYAGTGKPVAAIANAMWAEPQSLPASGNSSPSFVFVGSPTVGPLSWHGVDKIFQLAALIPDATFHVVGMRPRDFQGMTIPINVLMHGQMAIGALKEVYQRCDVAISTLALHRIQIDEASPLKTREYLMYGLPVVIGYREAEKSLNTAEYVLSLPNTENNATEGVAAIAKFSKKWVNKRISDDLRFMGRREKAYEQLEFLSTLIRTPPLAVS